MRIESTVELAEALVATLATGKRSACLFSERLEPALYGSPEFEQALRELALTHDRARIRVLVRHADRVLVDGDHRLVNLGRRMPSRIQVLQADEVAREDEREFLVVDNQALVLRTNAGRPDAIARDDDPGLARQTQRVFDRYWEQGLPAPELARLSL